MALETNSSFVVCEREGAFELRMYSLNSDGIYAIPRKTVMPFLVQSIYKKHSTGMAGPCDVSEALS